jgi:hypothetical protein
MLKPLRFPRAAVAGLSGLLVPTLAQALQDGQNFACNNCHEGQDKPEVVATFSEPRVEPGASVTITVTTTHPEALVGGVLVDSKGFGTFEIVDPTETHLFEETPTQVTHVAPKPYTDGQVEFAFRWVAPDTVGPYEFEIWANAANDNRDPHDDNATGITGNVAVGCDALWYYPDVDGDGWGDEAAAVYSCDSVPEHINQGGDCDDQTPTVNSAVTEVCNDIDDNCDGEVDEGFEVALWVEDLDADGFGSQSGQSSIGCVAPPGYGLGFGDCNDNDPAVNPEAVEVINGIDDNCNQERDEMSVTSGGAGGTTAASGGAAGTTAASGGTAVLGGAGPTASGGILAPVTPQVIPVGMGGAQAVPSQEPSPVGAAEAPASGASAGCALRPASPNVPTGVTSLIMAGFVLLMNRRRIRRDGAKLPARTDGIASKGNASRGSAPRHGSH